MCYKLKLVPPTKYEASESLLLLIAISLLYISITLTWPGALLTLQYNNYTATEDCVLLTCSFKFFFFR